MKKGVYLILIPLLLAAIFCWYMCIMIYEVKIETSADVLYYDNSSLSIKVIPVNAMGKKAWFRQASTEFVIQSGNELIEIIKNDSENGVLIIKASSSSGVISILIKPEKSLFPTVLEIPINPNIT